MLDVLCTFHLIVASPLYEYPSYTTVTNSTIPVKTKKIPYQILLLPIRASTRNQILPSPLPPPLPLHPLTPTNLTSHTIVVLPPNIIRSSLPSNQTNLPPSHPTPIPPHPTPPCPVLGARKRGLPMACPWLHYPSTSTSTVQYPFPRWVCRCFRGCPSPSSFATPCP